MIQLRAFILYISIVFVVSSCTTSTVEPDAGRLGYNYFPVEKGNFALYDVEETVYSLTGNPVTRAYQVKEVIAEPIVDLSNEEAFKVKRYSRPNAAGNWTLDSVWIAKRTVHQAIRTENNTSFVKLVFPLKENQKWNGNVFNHLGKDEYQLTKVNTPYTLSGRQFAHTATVVQVNDSSACNMKRVYEVYAETVGLVYKEKIVVEYRQTNNICQGRGDIQAGVRFYQKLIDHGKE